MTTLLLLAFRKTLCNMTFQPKTAITYRTKVRLQRCNTMNNECNNESIKTFSSFGSLSRYYNYNVFRQQNYLPLLISLHISIRPKVRRVNRKSASLSSTTINKSSYAVGTVSLSHTFQKLFKTKTYKKKCVGRLYR